MARTSWLDEADNPRIDNLARGLTTFLEAVADGRIDDDELEAQEKRVVDLMKAVEPLLSDEQHAKVTDLLCELTAYDIMQVLRGLTENRPRTQFQG